MDKIIQHPIGTRLWFVPIRYWENQTSETGAVALHPGLADGEIWPSFTDDGFVYAFHDGFGHTVYMKASDVFLTEAEAVAGANRRKAEKEAKDATEFEEWWQKTLASIANLR